MNGVAAFLSSLVGWPVYAVVAGAVFLETAALIGMIVPSEIILLFGAVLAAHGKISVVWLAGLALFAAVAGDTAGYFLGRQMGPLLVHGRIGRWIGPKRWERAGRFVERRGVGTLVLGRWVGYVRTLVPLVSGMGRMPFRRFFLSDITASALWVAGVVTLGFIGVGIT